MSKSRLPEDFITAVSCLSLLWFGAIKACVAGDLPAAATRPNVVFILADDLGWAELGCYGNRFNETPHLDAMARDGMRFTQAYAAAPVCSPYRVSLMTGQYPARVGITDYLRPDDPKHLPREQVTLAERFQQAGYVTGMIGKWHLTGYEHHGAEEVQPREQGFAEVICSERRGIAGGSYFHPYHFNPDIQPRLENEFLVDRMNLEAVEFIRRNRERPFFLYLSHYAVHTRLVGRPDLVAKYEARPGAGKGNNAPRNNPHLAAQLESIDTGVGMILDELAAAGLDRRTLVIFTSDNGGEARVTSNAPLRGGKSMLYEGGIREPLLVRLPGVVPPGTVSETPVSSIDFYPTLLEVAHVGPDPRQLLDGLSFLPVLKDPHAELPRETFYWHYPLEKPHFLGGRSAGALRHGDWKLIEFFDTGEVELYNLAADPSEEKNLAQSQAERLVSLRAELEAWRKRVGAEVPEPVRRARLPLGDGELLLEVRGTPELDDGPLASGRFDGVDDYLDLPRPQAPSVRGKTIRISAIVTPDRPNGVILAHGGNRHGYALYLADGKPVFCTCVDWRRTTIVAADALSAGQATIVATSGQRGELTLQVNDHLVAQGKAPGPLSAEPGDSLQVAADTIQPVGPYEAINPFAGRIDRLSLDIGD
jgi:arylsulfatase A-like enzyme